MKKKKKNVFANENSSFVLANNYKHNLVSQLVKLLTAFSPLYFKNILNTEKNVLTSFHLIFQNYFFSMFKYSFNFSLVNLSNIFSRQLLGTSIDRLKKLTPRRLRIYYFTELSEILLSTLFSKNLNFIMLWFKKLVETRDFRYFSSCRRYFQQLFFKFLWKLNGIVSLKGFFIKFKGKFLKGGGKKKKIIYRKGNFSFTTKDLRLVYKRIYIRTISGVIGFSVKLAY